MTRQKHSTARQKDPALRHDNLTHEAWRVDHEENGLDGEPESVVAEAQPLEGEARAAR